MYQAMQRPTNRPSYAQQSQFQPGPFGGADPLAAALAKFGIYPMMEMIPGKFSVWGGASPFPLQIEGQTYQPPQGMSPEILDAVLKAILGPTKQGNEAMPTVQAPAGSVLAEKLALYKKALASGQPLGFSLPDSISRLLLDARSTGLR